MNNYQIDLTTIETEKLTELETVIEHGLQTFVEVGNALMEIRDKRLYLVVHDTFENYCRDRWGFTRMRASQLISAVEVVQNVNRGLQIPQNERQARALVGLAPEHQIEVWEAAADTAPNGNITAAHIERTVQDYHRLRDGRRSQVSDIYTPLPSDACQTPAYAIDPLLPYLQEGWNIWEPAAGEGYLEGALYDSGFSVAPGDLITGQNFFDYEPERWDCLVTNPPFSTHSKWLKRCYQLGKPFALLMKVDILGNKGEQEMFDQFGIEVIFVSPRINFKMPRLGWGDGDHKSSATFATAWFTWGLYIGQQMTFAKINTEEG